MPMINPKDEALSFGTLTAVGTYPNIINLGNADASRMRVVVSSTGGSSLTATLKSGTDGSTFDTTLGTCDATEEGIIPIPEGAGPYLELILSGTSVTSSQANIDTYLGI